MQRDIEQLRAELLRRRLAGSQEGRPAGAIPRLATPGTRPLSSGQRRLWFLDAIEQDATDYLVPFVVRLRGQVDADAMHRAWLRLVERHEILRTRYLIENGRPVQETGPVRPSAFTRTDASSVAEDQRAAAVARIAARLASTPLVLADGDCARMELISFGPDDHCLAVVFHHIAFDGWSAGIFWADFGALYRAEVTGEPAGLPELPIQYGDFAAWQAAAAEGPEAALALKRWTGLLSGLAPLQLPVDRPRPKVRSTAGDLVCFTVPPRIAQAVQVIARRYETTPFTVLLTVLHVLLARYSGTADIAVAIPVAGRTEPQTHGLIGFFINTMIIRAQWGGDPLFGELLASNQTRMLDALEHQDVPFEQLVESVEPDRDLTRNPIAQVMFGYEETGPGGPALHGVRTEHVDVCGEGAKFDLNLQVKCAPGPCMTGSLEYATALFDRDTAERVVAHLLRLLDGVAADPATRLSGLDCLTDAERHALVIAANDTSRPRPFAAVHEVIGFQAAKTPDATAVVDSDGRTSYAKLEAQANRLARYLRAHGVGQETVVGVDLPRGAALVVTLLAVLKTGGAYLPLDPSDTPARRAAILADAGARALVTDRRRQDAEMPDGLAFIGWHEHREDIEACGEAPLCIPADPDSLAYVIYTSGTTGRPKGVMVSHQGLVNYLWWAVEAYGAAEGGTALFSSVAFDLGVPNLYASLMRGRPVHLLPQELDAFELGGALLAAGPLSFVKLAPGQLELLLSQLRPEQRSALAGLVVVAGDRFPRHLYTRWAADGASCPLASEYGPTEITVGNSACFPIGRELPELIPLGTPIPNTTAYVLDPSLRPQPAGVVGEVYVGGAGVARGYLGRPALTGERFVPDPFSQRPASRMYRTGDLARVLPDGSFEFAGRKDDQVKIRGYRVEPAEVANVMGRHPAVSAAVVTARRDSSGGAELVGYLVPAPGAAEPSLDALRSFLREWLPGYMIPSALVVLSELPLTTNGKVDLRALPLPGRDDRVTRTPYVLPRTDAEAELALVMSGVLEVPSVSVLDGFFELGGDSVRAVVLVGALREAGFDVSVRDVFEHRTVESLAAVLGARSAESLDAPLVQPFELLGPADRGLIPDDVIDAYPLSRIQLGMLLEMESSGGEGNYHNVTSYLIRDRRAFARDALQRAVDIVVARHEVMRTSMDLRTFSEPIQLVHRHAELPIGVTDMRGLGLAAQDASLRAYLAAERKRLFDISAPPLFRFHVQTYGNYWRLTFTEFHPILEGWSLHLMIMELLGYYDDIMTGREPSPPPLPAIRYVDFVALERRELEDTGHARYWHDVVTRYPPLALPGTWGSGSGPVESTYLSYADLEDGLREVARVADVPLKSVLHAAHLKVMSSLTAETAFCSGLVCDTRPEVTGSERVLGMYLNTVPFPFRTGKGNWIELVQEVFRTEIDIWPHRRYPLGDIQRPAAGAFALKDCFIFLDFRMVDYDLVDRDGGIDDSPNEFPLMVTANRGELCIISRPQDLDAAGRKRLGEMYRQVLEAMAADPGGDARRAFLAESDRGGLLASPAPRDALSARLLDLPVHRLVERQAARAPAAVAVVSGAEQLTYAELNGRANQLARALADLGAGPESLVAVHQDRSLDLVVSLLAVLKAGAAFLPIDPEYPRRWRQDLLASAAPAVLLTHSRWLPELSGAGLHALCPDRDHALVAGYVTSDLPDHVVSGDQAAYVIHTSGSTGRPKGAVNTHRALTNVLAWMQEAYRLDHSDVMLQKTPVSFDVSVSEFFWPLLAGARLVLARPGGHRDPRYLAEIIAREHVTVVQFVPTMLGLFLEAPGVGCACGSLRQVLSIGEALSPDLMRRAADILPHVAVDNLYGPAETAIEVTAWRCDPYGDQARVPIGRPIAGVRVHLCDPEGYLVPAGVPGELCIGGAAVGRGYLGQPGRTAERYVPDPFGEPGARLYRTGDRSRLLSGGVLEFLGRADRQVKLRGIRIEPAGIEAVIRRHSDVREAVVGVRGDGDSQRLVAWVVPAGNAPSPPALSAELRAHCAALMPPAMVPHSFRCVERMPFTANGKLDIAALPEATEAATSHQAAPRTRTELELLRMWEHVLKRSPIGIDDDFFELGGHSLDSIRLRALAERRLGTRVPMTALFDHRTIASQAAIFDQAVQGDAGNEHVPSPLISLRDGSRQPLFCVHPMGGTAFCYLGLARELPGGYPVYGIQAHGLGPGQQPRKSVREMAAAYLDAARTVRWEGPWQLAGWSFGAVVAHEMACQLADAGEEVGFLALLDPSSPHGDKEEPDELAIMAAFLQHAGALSGVDIKVDRTVLASVAPSARRGEVLAQVRAAHLLPAGSGDDELGRMLDVFIADWNAYVGHRPAPYHGPTLLFSTCGAAPRRSRTAWTRLCPAGPAVIDLPGGHFDVLRSASAARIADRLKRSLTIPDGDA